MLKGWLHFNIFSDFWVPNLDFTSIRNLSLVFASKKMKISDVSICLLVFIALDFSKLSVSYNFYCSPFSRLEKYSYLFCKFFSHRFKVTYCRCLFLRCYVVSQWMKNLTCKQEIILILFQLIQITKISFHPLLIPHVGANWCYLQKSFYKCTH